MTPPDKLYSKTDLKWIIENKDSHDKVRLAEQLLDTMLELSTAKEEIEVLRGDIAPKVEKGDKAIDIMASLWFRLQDRDREIEQHKANANKCGVGAGCCHMAAQIDTLSTENEQLRNLVEAFHHDTMYKDNPGLHDLAIEILRPNKPTVPCTSCGKPMEDRGASKQWCRECSGDDLPIMGNLIHNPDLEIADCRSEEAKKRHAEYGFHDKPSKAHWKAVKTRIEPLTERQVLWMGAKLTACLAAFACIAYIATH